MTRAFAIMTFVAALFFAASPFLTSGFNGFEPNQFPVPQENAPIQPSGYAFSIWGVIYIWLIAGTGFGLIARADAEDWSAGRPALFASLAIGASWLLVAQFSVVWATVLIWAMLIGALAAMLRSGSSDRWWQREPIGAYAGWLTAASSVSIGLLLAGFGLTTQTTAAFIGLAIALAVAVAMQKARPDTISYPLAVIWALIGVVVSNIAPLNTGVIGVASVGITYLAMSAKKSLDT